MDILKRYWNGDNRICFDNREYDMYIKLPLEEQYEGKRIVLKCRCCYLQSTTHIDLTEIDLYNESIYLNIDSLLVEDVYRSYLYIMKIFKESRLRSRILKIEDKLVKESENSIMEILLKVKSNNICNENNYGVSGCSGITGPTGITGNCGMIGPSYILGKGYGR